MSTLPPDVTGRSNESFFANILTPGSIHVFALMAIELCLWASVKWFVSELKKVPVQVEAEQDEGKLKEE
ncbi:unnamed protein product [Cyclocybe aegerita]|uniref:Uncharacterized protein n=1 Tax=Cyclocybe aegerita TaxID=1973307 RepID=A0A8S0W2T8_CYCAE|nr:unnamed protein product [Cyclocybe aegerita]